MSRTKSVSAIRAEGARVARMEEKYDRYYNSRKQEKTRPVWLVERFDLDDICFWSANQGETKCSSECTGEHYMCPNNWTSNLAHAVIFADQWSAGAVASSIPTPSKAGMEGAQQKHLAVTCYRITASGWLTRVPNSAIRLSKMFRFGCK